MAKDKTTNIYTNSWYAYGVADDFGILWKQGFLISNGDKIKNDSYVQNLVSAILLLAVLATIIIFGFQSRL